MYTESLVLTIIFDIIKTVFAIQELVVAWMRPTNQATHPCWNKSFVSILEPTARVSCS